MILSKRIFPLTFALMCFSAVPALAEEPAKPEAQLFDVFLLSFENKIQAVKAVHEIAGLGVKDSKDLVESVPKPILAGVPQTEAQGAKKHAEVLGCKIEIRAADPASLKSLPEHLFDAVIVKADAARREAQAAALAAVLADKDAKKSTVLLDTLPATVATGRRGELVVKLEALTAAGLSCELVSTGNVETGGYDDILKKADPQKKVRLIPMLRANTGHSLAKVKELVEGVPSVIKIKMTEEQATKLKLEMESAGAEVELKKRAN